jgi:phosphatidylserine/phosphatidylglycerophosphate/cardiolipin synthase-like enzyme
MRRAGRLAALLLAVAARAAEPQACFSPDGGCRTLLIRTIDRAEHTIELAVFTFTDGAVADALGRATGRGVKVRAILDQRQAKQKSSQAITLQARRCEVRLLHGVGRGGLMHHKFLVVDGRLVWTGSYNFTGNADHNNADNGLLLEDARLAGRYREEFERIWKEGVKHRTSPRR